MPDALQTVCVYRIRDAAIGNAGADVARAVVAEGETPTLQVGRVSRSRERLLLAVARVRRPPPAWKEILQPAFANPIDVSWSQSSGGLLIVQPPTEPVPAFAFTFGNGRHLLNPAVIEPGFGLRVALNTVCGPDPGATTWDAERLRMISARRVGARTVATLRQMSRQATFEAFGVDVQRDIIRSVTGRPVAADWGSRITGADACRLSRTVALADLGALCTTLEETFREDYYRRRFPWIDNVRPVTDPALIRRLDQVLLNALRAPGAAPGVSIELAPPLIVDWDAIHAFQLRAPREQPLPDVTLEDYKRLLVAEDRWGSLDIPALKRHTITALTDADMPAKWPVYRCLTGEMATAEGTFVLDEGHYYKIDPRFVAELDAYLATIGLWAGQLPAWPRRIPVPAGTVQNETYYNVSASSMLSGAVTMHERLVSIAARTDTVEVCDILTAAGDLIHVKRDGASSVLSHLFSQGTIAGELVADSPDFRAGALVRLHQAIAARGSDLSPADGRALRTIFAAKPQPDQLQVVYAMATPRTAQGFLPRIPFFSKINLRAHAEELRRMGYRVAYAIIVRPRTTAARSAGGAAAKQPARRRPGPARP